MTMAEQYEWHQAYLRRHRVSRRSFLRGSVAVAAVAAVGVSPFGRRAYAQDAPLAVANRRVGYGADASSQLRFGAQLSRNPGSGRIFLDHGPSPELGATVDAEIRNLVTQIPDSDGGVLAAEQFYAHVPVDGLPGRVPHFYRWRTEDGFVGDILSATTAMPSTRDAVGPFRFTMMGDQGTDERQCCRPGWPVASMTTVTTSPTTIPRCRTPTMCSTRSLRPDRTFMCWPATSPTPTPPERASRRHSCPRRPTPRPDSTSSTPTSGTCIWGPSRPAPRRHRGCSPPATMTWRPPTRGTVTVGIWRASISPAMVPPRAHRSTRSPTATSPCSPLTPTMSVMRSRRIPATRGAPKTPGWSTHWRHTAATPTSTLSFASFITAPTRPPRRMPVTVGYGQPGSPVRSLPGRLGAAGPQPCV